MEEWLNIPKDRKASRSGRLCLLIAITVLMVVSAPMLWAGPF